MTTAPQQTPSEGYSDEPMESWTEGDNDATAAPHPSYPELPANPHESPLSVNFSDRYPQVTIRGRNVDEWSALVAQVAASGVLTKIHQAWQALKGAQPAQEAAPQRQFPQQGYGAPQQAPQQPNVPFQGQPAWQTAGSPQGGYQAPSPVPPGWFKLNVPFPQKATFDAIVTQNGIRKGDPNNGGQVSFQKAVKSWFCSPEVAPAFAQFSPTPA